MKLLSLALCVVVATATSARAVLNVGDTAQVQFTAADGTRVDLAQLKGKLVVLDMWATWCGPCMAEAGHMVQINKTYGDKGLQMIGISLDQDKAQMMSVAKDKGFTWPQYFDGQVWQNKYATQFGVNSIPRTFLFGPDGKLLWTGHPAEIDQPLAQAFKEHPPQLVDPAVLASANTILQQIDEKLQNKDPKGAIALFGKIPAAAKADAAFADKLQQAQTQVENAAKAMLSQVQPLIDAKQYSEAVTKLKQLTSALSGMPAGDKARQMLDQLLKNPEAKQALADQEKEARADAALETAQKLQAEKKDALAYPQFKQIVTAFPGTPAATTAAKAVAVYEEDSAFIAKFNSTNQSQKAKSLLSMAKSYSGAGQTDLAMQKYQQVLKEFPGTEYATAAQQGIDALSTK
jgi:thiol-disulfide isomerase/thioredoxin/outer membrane protein assembly factor BamD (BamD/ComL family)